MVDGEAAPIEPLLMAPAEAARLLAVPPRSIAYLTTAGTLPTVKIGRRRLIAVADLRAFVDRLSALPLDDPMRSVPLRARRNGGGSP